MRCSTTDDPELLRVARVGLGALGIVTEVTLQCVPAFRLHARETIEVLDDVLDGFAERAAAVDHFELYWMPGARRCQVKRNARTDEPARPQPRWAYVRDKWVAENLAFGARVPRRPAVPGRRRRASPSSSMSAASERELVDRSDRVFCSPRHVRFVEMEYGVPVEHLPEAVRRVRELTRTLTDPGAVPDRGPRVGRRRHPAVDRRTAGPSGWIAVHQYRACRYEEYFAGVERIMDDYGGPPPLGQAARPARRRPSRRATPSGTDFAAARDRLDPDRTFANPYLDRVLG